MDIGNFTECNLLGWVKRAGLIGKLEFAIANGVFLGFHVLFANSFSLSLSLSIPKFTSILLSAAGRD